MQLLKLTKPSPSLEELKQLLKEEFQREKWDSTLFPCGIPKGAITQIIGPGKTQSVLDFLKEYPETKIAWIEENFSAFPIGFTQRETSLDRVLFIEGRKKTFWATLQVLRSQVFSIVVIYSDFIDWKSLRRIQIEAEKSQTTVFWLGTQTNQENDWPISLQIQIDPLHKYNPYQILRQKG